MDHALKDLVLNFIVPFLCCASPRCLSSIQKEAAASAMYASVNRSFHQWIQPCLEYQRLLWLNMLRAILKRKTFAEELKTLPTFTPEEFVEAMNIVMSRESMGPTTTRTEMPA